MAFIQLSPGLGWCFLPTADSATRNLFCDNQTSVIIARHHSMVIHSCILCSRNDKIRQCKTLQLPSIWWHGRLKIFCILCDGYIFSIWETKRFYLKCRHGVLGEQISKFCASRVSLKMSDLSPVSSQTLVPKQKCCNSQTQCLYHHMTIQSIQRFICW